MKNILITGAKGFLGKSLALYYKNLGYSVYGIGYGQIKKENFLNFGLLKWLESDITVESIKKFDIKFDIIIHCAGSASVHFSVENPFDDFKKSVDSTLELLEYIRIYNQKTIFVYPSSPAVQGVHNDSPINEEFIGIPASPYGVHKRIAEELVKSYSNFYNIKVLILRYYSVYGIGLKKQLLWDALNKFNNNNNITFFGTGNETRDWIYIDDAVKYTDTIIQFPMKSNFEIYNVGTGIRTEIKDILTILNNKFKNQTFTFTNHEKEGDPKYYLANIEKMKALNYNIQTSLEDGISKYVNWYKKEVL